MKARSSRIERRRGSCLGLPRRGIPPNREVLRWCARPPRASSPRGSGLPRRFQMIGSEQHASARVLRCAWRSFVAEAREDRYDDEPHLEASVHDRRGSRVSSAGRARPGHPSVSPRLRQSVGHTIRLRRAIARSSLCESRGSSPSGCTPRGRPRNRSPFWRNRSRELWILNCEGSRPFFTSSHSSGVDTGAPG